jgi:hypothetical protein
VDNFTGIAKKNERTRGGKVASGSVICGRNDALHPVDNLWKYGNPCRRIKEYFSRCSGSYQQVFVAAHPFPQRLSTERPPLSTDFRGKRLDIAHFLAL